VSNVTLAVVALTIAGCRDGSTTSSWDYTSGVVYGQVIDQAQRPIAGAMVRPTTHSDSASCRDGTRDWSVAPPVRTDSAGRYRSIVSLPLSPSTVCVGVQVVRAAGIGWDGSTRAGGQWLRLTAEDWVGLRDSVRIDVQLPAR
jgi:hypothetical protein